MKLSKFSGLLLTSVFFSSISVLCNVKVVQANCDWFNLFCTNNPNSGVSTIDILPSPPKPPKVFIPPPIVPHQPTVPSAPIESEAEAEARKELAAKELAEKIALDRANASNERANIIIKALSSQADVRNITLQRDPDRKLTGVCYQQKEFSYKQINHDNANHPDAYADGYREGKMNAQKGEKYVARSGGGEFSRGFDDGYYGKNSTGQDPNVTVNDTSQDIYRWNEKCTGV